MKVLFEYTPREKRASRGKVDKDPELLYHSCLCITFWLGGASLTRWGYLIDRSIYTVLPVSMSFPVGRCGSGSFWFRPIVPTLGSGWEGSYLPAKPLLSSQGRVWAAFALNLIFSFSGCSCLSSYLTFALYCHSQD